LFYALKWRKWQAGQPVLATGRMISEYDGTIQVLQSHKLLYSSCGRKEFSCIQKSYDYPLHRYEIRIEILAKMKLFRTKPATHDSVEPFEKKSGIVHITMPVQILFISRS